MSGKIKMLSEGLYVWRLWFTEVCWNLAGILDLLVTTSDWGIACQEQQNTYLNLGSSLKIAKLEHNLLHPSSEVVILGASLQRCK